VQGLELSRRFYLEAVRPILERDFPDFEHAAALIGYGSDVLGYDDETSQDHEWGPRVLLFGRDADRKAEIEERLAHELPTAVAGFSTHFGSTEEAGTMRIAIAEARPIAHRAEVLVLHEYLRGRIGFDPLQGVTARDWLVTPSQRLLEVTAGDVFADSIGDLTRVRELLGFYPHDVWLYVLAGQWRRIAQLEHFLGRTGASGDELGSRVIAASLVRDLMRLALLQERRYPPYAKWLGSAYGALERSEASALLRSLAATDWRSREDALVEVYEAVALRHNELGITDAVEPTVRPFWGRPFRVLFADRFVDALRAAISDEDVRMLDHVAGSIDAVSDNVDLLTSPRLWRRVASLYES
jgi:Domain of unknown function (DUF4037)